MRKKLLILVAILVLAISACALFACGDNTAPAEPTPQDPSEFHAAETPTSGIYTQAESIGWDKSYKNVDKDAYGDYFNSGEPTFIVPGLAKGQNFVLQGIEYCASRDWALLCGYITPATDNSNSVIFVIDMAQKVWRDGGKSYSGRLIKEVLLDKADGTAFKGHAGGIAVSQNTVWLSNDSQLYYFPLSALDSAPASSHIRLEKSVQVPVNASYASFSDGVLWVGEFEYARDDYDTDASHHRGDLTAWTVGYILDESGAAGYDAETGIKTAALGDVAIPDIVLWHGEKVQGMATAGGKVVLSTSYGRKNNSVLYFYDSPFGAQADEYVEIGGAHVPVYILSAASRTMTAPPMTEDLGVISQNGVDYLLIASESSCYNYHGYKPLNVSSNPVDFVWKLRVDA